jgi:hypothetical protein
MRVRTTVAAVLAIVATSAAAAEPAKIDFNRQVRPILANNCFKCHGRDEAARQAGLRLDVAEEATRVLDSGHAAIVPLEPEASALVARVTSADEDVVMPPPETNKRLTDAEKEILRRWIAEGAEYQPHWAFVAPRRPALPAVADAAWPRNPIDRFVLARLEAEGLRPAPEAAREALLRRVTLDLTGLPPTIEELDAYLADARPGAYERVVERLLRSPNHGERLALDWLDAARFADTHGYHIDAGRDMSRWRRWVIDAFNRNLPFDRFTVEQLAGDLLPDATTEARLASGFNRNHMINFEGGAVPLEYHTAYIVDRVNTTGTVWLGLTVGCSQCHDHKYDPLTQREYYQLFAFFHNVPENGLDGSKGNAAPLLRVPTPEQEAELAAIDGQIARLVEELAGPLPEADAAQAAWEASLGEQPAPAWAVLEPQSVTSAGGATLQKQEDGSILASGANPATETYTLVARVSGQKITALRLELLPDASFTNNGPGRSVNGNVVLTDARVAVQAPGDAAPRPAAWRTASADFSQDTFPVAQAIDQDRATGWAIHPEVGKAHAAVLELAEPIDAQQDVELTVTLDFQSQFGQHQAGRFRLAVTEAADPHGGALPDYVAAILARPAAQRTADEARALRDYFRNTVSAAGRELSGHIEALRERRAAVEQAVGTTMVMEEMPQPRETFLLVRGQYDKPGDRVQPGVPGALHALPAGAPGNRLGLAEWIVSPDNPLTARVIANRYWQMFFGTGLVETSEDFGVQGALPSHPELLDWLAVEFARGAADEDGLATESPPTGRGEGAVSDYVAGAGGPWNVRHLVRLIVTSAAYRQSAAVTAELVARDPHNRLLARGPRMRLPAEFIRDQALAVSGLMDRRIGGASVSPYQPAGLWEELMSREDGANWTAQTYVQSHGADLYRRTMYTFWKRTSPPPTLATFDAPDRETCTVRRARTNTPLQALILLNDPTYVEASRKLAERVLGEVVEGRGLRVEGPEDGTDEARLVLAFRLCTSRRPTQRELGVLRRLLDEQRSAYRADASAADALLAVGESPRDATLDPAELAAWTMLASAILNLDETVTK